MSLADATLFDLLGALLGFGLTLVVFSYVLGDNFLFRVAIHAFIGVAAGFAVVSIFYNVLLPQLFEPLISGDSLERLLALIPLILGLFLLARFSQRFAVLSSPVLAFLVGVGAAAAVGGAVIGTLFPQVGASVNTFDLLAVPAGSSDYLARLVGKFGNASIMLVGTLATLIYFHFGVRSTHTLVTKRPPWIEAIAWVGQVFIALTLGTIFAGVYAAALAALIERSNFLINLIFSLISPAG
jgi:hypothetical protein